MKDHIVRATAQGIRVFAAVTTNLVEEARRRHDCFPVAAAALGRTMTASLLLAANLKTEESITVRIHGNGPLGDIIADAYANGTVRGYVQNPHVNLPLKNEKLDVGGGVGTGSIYVTRFVGLKQPFTGSSELVSGEIAEDMTNYLAISEQTPSSVALGVLVNTDLSVAAAGGFLLQALPGAEDGILEKLEINLTGLFPVSQLIKEGNHASDIIGKIFKGLSVAYHEETPLSFQCTCSRERVQNMLISLGEKELTDMLQDKQSEICCHFCAEKYYFTAQEIAKLLETLSKKG